MMRKGWDTLGQEHIWQPPSLWHSSAGSGGSVRAPPARRDRSDAELGLLLSEEPGLLLVGALECSVNVTMTSVRASSW